MPVVKLCLAFLVAALTITAALVLSQPAADTSREKKQAWVSPIPAAPRAPAAPPVASPVVTPPVPAAPTPLTVTSWRWARTSWGTAAISGIVTNASARHYRYVQVTFTLYNKRGAQVGSAFTNIAHLDAYGTWEFQALALADGVHTAKLQEVTGF